MTDKIIQEFREKFVTESVFGVSIGAIDNLKESGLKQIESFLTDSLTTVYTEAYKKGYAAGKQATNEILEDMITLTKQKLVFKNPFLKSNPTPTTDVGGKGE